MFGAAADGLNDFSSPNAASVDSVVLKADGLEIFWSLVTMPTGNTLTKESDATKVTFTATKQLPPAASVALASEKLPAPATAVTTAPGQLLTALGDALSTMPLGMLSMKPVLVRSTALPEVFCRFTVKRDTAPTDDKVGGSKLLPMFKLPGAYLFSVADAGDALNTPLLAFTSLGLMVFTDGELLELTTSNCKVQLVLANKVTLETLATDAPDAAVTTAAPPQVVLPLAGLATVKPDGKLSVPTKPVSAELPTFWKVTLARETPPSPPTMAGLKLLFTNNTEFTVMLVVGESLALKLTGPAPLSTVPLMLAAGKVLVYGPPGLMPTTFQVTTQLPRAGTLKPVTLKLEPPGVKV